MNLYVSDLDGTLLNSNKEISEKSKSILNNLINRGVKFTVATARTPGTVIDLLKGLDLRIPVVLMNGVIIYNINEKEYISYKTINKTSARKIVDICEKTNKNIFLYTIENNNLIVYYKDLKLKFDNDFYKERAESKYKSFVNVESYDDILEEKNIINIVIMDKLEVIELLHKEIISLGGIYVNFSQDIYNKDCYFLEVHSDLASKAKGIKELSSYIDYDKLVSFGDNTNDISMFKLSDEAYAMSNAVEELKDIATGVIASNGEDGVAEFIKNNVGS